MPTIAFNTLQSGENHVLLKPDADLSKLVDGSVTAWTFENKPRNTGTLIRANDKIASYGLAKDKNGDPNPAALNLATAICHMVTLCTYWTKNGRPFNAPFEAETVEAECPPPVLTEYFRQTYPEFDWSAVIKKPEETESGSDETPPNETGETSSENSGSPTT